MDKKYFGLDEDLSLSYSFAPQVLEVEKIEAIHMPKPTIIISFSQELAKNSNIKNFIDIKPNTKFEAAINGNTIRITGRFDTTESYDLHIKDGIKSASKAVLQESLSQQVQFLQMKPQIVFSQSGIFLPSDADKKVAFKSVNVKKVHLKLSKIYPNNITHYMLDQKIIGDISYKNEKSSYDEDYYKYYGRSYSDIYRNFDRLGDVVLEKDFDIDYVKNQWVQSQLDFSEFKADDGIYIIELSFDENGIDYTFENDSWMKRKFLREDTKISKHLIFSSIALIVQENGDKLDVFALDIATNKPLSKVQINAISAKNQILTSATTDGIGFASFNDKKNIAFISASKDDSHSILRLIAPLSNEGFSVDGEFNKGGVNAYIYTDRGVYRPGESVNINVIARLDSESSSSPITHPIKITLTNPRDKKVLEDFVIKKNVFGNFHHELKLDSNAPTGIWRLKVDVADSSFWHNISVENVVAERLKVDVQTSKNIISEIKNDGELKFNISSSYLFGAPASNLRYETSLYVTDVKFNAPNYKDYTFNDFSSSGYDTDDYAQGNLDENGKAEDVFELNANYISRLGRNLNAFLITKVFESGNRFSTSREKIEINLVDSFVGIKAPKGEIEPNTQISLPVIVLSSKTQEPVANKKINYRIYHNAYSWWWDYDSYTEFTRSIKGDRNTKLVQEGSLKSSTKPVNLNFTPNMTGEFLIEVENDSNNTRATIVVHIDEDSQPSFTPKEMQLSIKSDKTQYTAKEKAKVSFEGAKNSKAMVSIINRENVVKRLWVNAKEGMNEVEIPLDSSYAPNVYVAVSLLQDYKTLNNDRSQRLYGVIPLMVEDPKKRLDVEISAPKQIRPNTKFSVKLSNKQKKKTAYTLAIADQGLLQLTDFQSPDPLAFFSKKLALMSSLWDTYDLIIGKDKGKIHQILKVGGDEFLSGRKNLNEAQRFKPVIFYVPPTMSDDNGNSEFSFEMPSFMGSVRIMAVAVNDDSLGSNSQNMTITAPVAMLGTIPRSLKMGDKFELGIEVLPTKENVGNTKITLKSGEKIKLEKQEITLNLKDKKSQMLYVSAWVQPDMIGKDFIEITLSNNDFKMVEKTQIDVLPNNPYTAFNKKFTLDSKQTLELSNPKNIVKDSAKGYVLVSSSPILSIDHRLKWLIAYPYGCIEQTTSSVLPQLFIQNLSKGDFIDKSQIVKNINAGIARIANFQTNDGGFSYWQGQSDSDDWGSSYAGHFLLLAKKQGYYVNENMLNRWINHQISYVKEKSDANKLVYPLYLLALAGKPQIGIMNNVYEKDLQNLYTNNLWFLAAAYKLSGMDDIAKKIIKDLDMQTFKSSIYYDYYSYGSPLRSLAMILHAYNQIYGKPHDDLLRFITNELEGDDWYSTQTLGYSLLALSSIKGESNKDAFSIDFNGKKFDGNGFVRIPFDEFEGKLVSDSANSLFVSQSWEGILLDKITQAKASKIALSREFLDEQGSVIDPSSLESGKSFYIKLSLDLADSQNRYRVSNVAISQKLPSGWEIENTRLNNDDVPKFARSSRTTYTDVLDDEIRWFLDFDGGTKVMFVKINTITPGEYLLPPATAEAMYDNSFYSNTDSMDVEVLK